MRLAKAPKIAFSFPRCFTRLRGDLPYKGSLARSFFRGGLKNGVLGINKRVAGRGAGASTAKLCEACDVGGDQQVGKIQLRKDLFDDMNIGRSCLLVLANAPARFTSPPLFSRSCPVEIQYAHGLSLRSVAVGCSLTLLTPCFASCSSLCTEQVFNAH